MKIRSGFVTNSSSTSFLIITKEDLSKENFFELLGVDPASPISDLFEAFYQAVVSGISDEMDISPDGVDEDVLLRFGGDCNLSNHMVTKIREAKANGAKVLHGGMSSEENVFESFFCTDSFEIENDKIYFNGLNCVW